MFPHWQWCSSIHTQCHIKTVNKSITVHFRYDDLILRGWHTKISFPCLDFEERDNENRHIPGPGSMESEVISPMGWEGAVVVELVEAAPVVLNSTLSLLPMSVAPVGSCLIVNIHEFRVEIKRKKKIALYFSVRHTTGGGKPWETNIGSSHQELNKTKTTRKKILWDLSTQGRAWQ